MGVIGLGLLALGIIIATAGTSVPVLAPILAALVKFGATIFGSAAATSATAGSAIGVGAGILATEAAVLSFRSNTHKDIDAAADTGAGAG